MWTALVTVYVIWGSTYLGIAYAGETIPPLFAASTRFITAGVLMAGVVRARGGSLRISRRALFSCVLVGAPPPRGDCVPFLPQPDGAHRPASLVNPLGSPSDCR